MDNEQKISLLKLMTTHCKCPDEGYGRCNVCEFAVKEIIQDIEKAEKYKWHDLRKNPEDLPEIEFECLGTSKIVLAVTEGFCYRIAIYDYKEKEWNNFPLMTKVDGNVEFWKYEPFEEV